METNPKRLQQVCKFFSLVFIGLFVTILFSPVTPLSADSRDVYIIQLDDATINPVTADYIIHAIDKASGANAQCLIVELDTPGGLLTSTRSIVKSIMASQIPVVIYIYPSGSRAGSAGVFITYASHVAAMAHSTNIGAAHPVNLGGQKTEKRSAWDALRDTIDAERKTKEENEEKMHDTKTGKKIIVKENKLKETPKEDVTESEEDPMSSKILNDTVAFIKAMAKERGRNSEWAQASVTQSVSITEKEALEKGVIEIIADNEQDLLNQLDGRVVKVKGQEVTLATKNANIVRILMDSRQKFLNILANPNIAYLFFILGFYGLLFEVTHPGVGLPGILGVIFLILAFFSMQLLPTNYAGLALIILAIVLFIAEAKVPGFGLLTLGGVVCMILGSTMLFDSSQPVMRVSISLVLSLTLTTAAITTFLVRLVIISHHKKVISGKEGLIAETGYAHTNISSGKEGKVFVHGEIWNATSEQEIRQGEKITVVKVEGMTLGVKKS